MIIVAYDISNNKLRLKFAKFLESYGRRIQYSVFEIKHSKRMLKNILIEIEYKYQQNFEMSDSILIFETHNAKTKRYGYAANEEKELLIF